MKILFLTEGKLPDYQSDMILHGLRASGYDVVDYPQSWYMYKDLKERYWSQRITPEGYGKGFTINGTLDNIDIDRGDIEEKIVNKIFDIVIYGSCRRNLEFLDIVKNNYKKEEIYFIDGEDHQNIDWKLVDIGKYFKRELISFDKRVYPIEFCIPKEKIYRGEVNKVNIFSTVNPNSTREYIYDKEIDYYEDYRKSKYGITTKKAGWDCLRHYEIIMNKCLPYFKDINECPERTMIFYPKNLCKEINKDIKNNLMYKEKYDNYLNEMITHLENYLTTEKISNYLLNI